MFRFSERSKNRMVGVNLALIEIANRALKLTSVDFGIPEYGGLRSADQQNRLFHNGKSKLDGYEKKSYHQSGNALDVYAYVDGRASWMPDHLTSVAAAMLQAASELGYKIEWGGHWKSFQDMPHFQLVEE